MQTRNNHVLAVERLTKRAGSRNVLDNVSLEVATGETVGICGPRGAGKRRLLELIAGNGRVNSGRIFFAGHDVTDLPARRRKRLGLASPLQQDPFSIRVREAVFPRTLEQRLAGALALYSADTDRAHRRELIKETLSMMSLDYVRDKRPGEMSSGERLRAAVAELLICGPKLILLDEPYKSLDAVTDRGFEALIRGISRQASVLLTDRSGRAARLCDRVIALEAGRIEAADRALRIFINYRRDDDPGFAQALFLQLENSFDRQHIFMDVEGHIRPGDEYESVLRDRVENCDVLLAVIGSRWLPAADNGGRRLDNPLDWVRVEIVSALKAGRQVIPLLIGDTDMPPEEALPEPLRAITDRQAVRIRPESFKPDVQRLVDHLRTLRTARG